ncbi:MAG: hypothetical protein NDJ89_14805 [Oligoflexia bacterium]|nr:hypothetical protein [Oligoflexia bacterium]
MLPVKELVNIAIAVVLGMTALHPTDWKIRLWKVQFAMLREVRDTRSWGTLPTFPYRPVRKAAKGGPRLGR